MCPVVSRACSAIVCVTSLHVPELVLKAQRSPNLVSAIELRLVNTVASASSDGTTCAVLPPNTYLSCEWLY